MPITIRTTEGGYAIGGFIDADNAGCTIEKQPSSDTILLGPLDANLPIGMRLTREQVADLLPVLKRFVDTGEIIE